MKLLFLGAGATGGFFGGHLAKSGADVTFLVRPARRAQLERDGIRIEGTGGKFQTPVKAVTQDEIDAPYDAVIVSCKAYDLDSAITAIAPAVGATTLILPLLNGMKHLDALDSAFGRSHVLGGLCHISVTLTEDGTIRNFGHIANLTLGPRVDEQKPMALKLHETLVKGTEANYAENINAAIWEKWFFIAALASSTCLMRSTVGEVVRAGGAEFMIRLLAETVAVASANGYPPDPKVVEAWNEFLTDPASKIAASMLRDIQRGSRIEADQIVGDLIRRGHERGVATPLLDTALVHLEAYQNRLAPGPAASA